MPSSSNPQWLYDVFINFRGKDTRGTFVSHLYAALSNAGINTFLDNENLPKGKELGPQLWRAIEGSQIAIVVFSPEYVHSNWCLDELVQIMKCYNNMGQVVMPVFNGISPSFIRQYAVETFVDKHQFIKRVGERKEALNSASDLSGWDMKNYSNENSVLPLIFPLCITVLCCSMLMYVLCNSSLPFTHIVLRYVKMKMG
ncbi:unnamed protein product [Trifolium pratense]|uniref:Uncharacterized protein n=1 Tax=Trifolium pratense TaxID=57577 RepID=A0ACB0IS86_TRIPR|nr:unnamed protein product [Trifolium pratense]